MAASCCVSGLVLLEEEPADCSCEDNAEAAEFDVVVVPLFLLANSQPEKRPTPKMMASTSARTILAPARPGRLRGAVDTGRGPEGYLGGCDAYCSGRVCVAG